MAAAVGLKPGVEKREKAAKQIRLDVVKGSARWDEGGKEPWPGLHTIPSAFFEARLALDEKHMVKDEKKIPEAVRRAAEPLKGLAPRDAVLKAARSIAELLREGEETVVGRGVSAISNPDVEEILGKGKGSCTHFAAVFSEILWAAGVRNAVALGELRLRNAKTGEPYDFGMTFSLFGTTTKAHAYNLVAMPDGSTAIVDTLWKFVIFHDAVFDASTGEKLPFDAKEGRLEFITSADNKRLHWKKGDSISVGYGLYGIIYPDGRSLEASSGEEPDKIEVRLPGIDRCYDGWASIWPSGEKGHFDTHWTVNALMDGVRAARECAEALNSAERPCVFAFREKD